MDTRKPVHFGPDVDAIAARAIREGRLSQAQIDIIRSRRISSEELREMGRKVKGFGMNDEDRSEASSTNRVRPISQPTSIESVQAPDQSADADYGRRLLRYHRIQNIVGYAFFGCVLAGALFGNSEYGDICRVIGAVVAMAVAFRFKLI